MVSASEPSAWRSGSPASAISATTWPGIANSQSSSPLTSFATMADASGAGTRRRILCCSPVKVNDCQSVERNSVSKILSRFTPPRRSRERSNPAAAGDIASRIIAASPDRREPALSSSGEALSPCADRKQIGGRRPHPCRIGLVRPPGGVEISRLLSTNTRLFPTSSDDSATHPFPTHFLLV